MKSLKHPHFLILCALIVLSCKKQKQVHLTTKESVLPGPAETIPTETIPTENAIYLPIKIEGSGLSLTLRYQDNTALLTEIADAGKNKTLITYNTEQQLQKLEQHIGKEIHITFYEREDKKNITKTLNYFEKSKNRVFVGSHAFTYNEQKKIGTVNYYNEYNVLLKTDKLQYTESLNLSTINTLNPENSSVYTHDKKKGISSAVSYSEVFSLTLEHWFLWCSNNNVLTITNQKYPKENRNISYEYNENDYPSSMTITSNTIQQTFKITYKKLEQ